MSRLQRTVLRKLAHLAFLALLVVWAGGALYILVRIIGTFLTIALGGPLW